MKAKAILISCSILLKKDSWAEVELVMSAFQGQKRQIVLFWGKDKALTLCYGFAQELKWQFKVPSNNCR
ncbi:hypothetical protein [Kiloniella sp.]|uniref:hypothetical protein n=1 Tax=Kiloniella sp. TaxID=1938587 RepID=UPI003B02AEC3